MSQSPGVDHIAVALWPVVRPVRRHGCHRRARHRIRCWIPFLADRIGQRGMQRDTPHLRTQFVELVLEVRNRRSPQLEGLLNCLQARVVGLAALVDGFDECSDLLLHGRHLLSLFGGVAGAGVGCLQGY